MGCLFVFIVVLVDMTIMHPYQYVLPSTDISHPRKAARRSPSGPLGTVQCRSFFIHTVINSSRGENGLANPGRRRRRCWVRPAFLKQSAHPQGISSAGVHFPDRRSTDVELCTCTYCTCTHAVSDGSRGGRHGGMLACWHAGR
jgi:hypothetical protein